MSFCIEAEKYYSVQQINSNSKKHLICLKMSVWKQHIQTVYESITHAFPLKNLLIMHPF